MPERAGCGDACAVRLGTHWGQMGRGRCRRYVILFTPGPGMHSFQTLAGMELLVQVHQKSMYFNDLLGRSMSAPIISQHSAAPKK